MLDLSDPGFIYIGGYYHLHDKDMSALSEKKIGKSINVPARETALNSTKFTIGYTMIKCWAVDSMSKVEKSIHTLLPDRMTGEWFEDDGTLVGRLSEFMRISGFEEESFDALDETAQEIVQDAKKDRSRISELTDLDTDLKQFAHTRGGITVTVEVIKDGFLCLENGVVYKKTPNKAFVDLWTGKIPQTASINAWTNAKNSQGRSIDDELARLPGSVV